MKTKRMNKQKVKKKEKTKTNSTFPQNCDKNRNFVQFTKWRNVEDTSEMKRVG